MPEWLRWLLGGVGIIVLIQLVLVLALVVHSRWRYRRPLQAKFVFIKPLAVMVEDTEVQLYANGRQLFADMLVAIEEAEKTIYFESFLWYDDDFGDKFKEALLARAEAGVEVHIIYDWLGNLTRSRRFKWFPDKVKVLPFRSWRYPWHFLSPRHYSIDHRKLLVVDNRVGFVGGYNIGRPFQASWRDTHVRLTGPIAQDLGYGFADFWNEHHDKKVPMKPPPRHWSPTIRVHRNDPFRLSYPIRTIYLEAIEHAQKSIYITNAYFVPDAAFREGLMKAARRGVDVRILLPWQGNHVLVDWLARHYFMDYLAAGIRIFGYQGVMIHAKTATIDGVWSMVGTANIDRLSMWGNYEINVELFSEGVAAQMEEFFVHDVTNAWEITAEVWMEREWYVRLSEWVLAPLWPWV
ncbi:MAG TPA: phospholipase D-like domain-containing protein [Anaerolineae bacterium]|nr:phospholipase D-like domain-containing protein [Anaerolineae bacterium]